MADQKISQLNALTGANTASGDLVTIVDISDTTMGASGTNKKMTLTEFQASPVSAGTANGVVFLNGSKVETSGSALTFDGTNFATTGTASAAKLIPTGGTATGNGMYLPSANTLGFSTNGVLNAVLDASGNLGLGVTPSVWQLGKAFEVGAAGVGLWASSGFVNTMQNVAYNGSAYKYSVNGTAARYEIEGDVFKWYNAPSGTAGNTITFTQAMTLDASGNLGIGTATFGTSAAGVLSLGTGTAPTTGPADTVQLFSVDRSAGNTIPAVRCEGSGVTNAGITNTTVTHKIAMQVNGTIYYLLATTNAT